MLAGSLAAGCASMSRQASETWKHLTSASWLRCWAIARGRRCLVAFAVGMLDEGAAVFLLFGMGGWLSGCVCQHGRLAAPCAQRVGFR